jgi:hypothetical protein
MKLVASEMAECDAGMKSLVEVMVFSSGCGESYCVCGGMEWCQIVMGECGP